MARHKDSNWSVPEKPDMAGATLTVLMDIRDELKSIRQLQERTLGCWRFAEMPLTMERIDKRLKNAGYLLSKVKK